MVSRQEVRRVARLAKLALGDAEEERLARELSAILEYVDLLRGIDDEAVPDAAIPLAPPSAEGRPDEPAPGVPRTAILALAPDADPGTGTFRVPPVLDLGGGG